MREILFRGKRVDNGEWIGGCLIKGLFFTRERREDIPYIMSADDIEYDCFDDFTEDNGIYRIIPETVGQYTGLHDKKGKEIFEGDVVTDKKAKNIGVITSGVYEECPEYYADHNGYYVKWTDNSFKPQLNFWCRQKYIEVIGNIFDNSELLEANQC